MVVFGWIIIILMDRSDNEPLDYWLILAVWAVPFLTVPMGMSVVLSISFLPIVAFGARIFWRLWQEEQQLGSTDLQQARLAEPGLYKAE